MNIRETTVEDLKALFEWVTDEHICRTWGGPKVRFPLTLETVREDIQFGKYPTYSLVDDSDELLGIGQVVDIDENRFHLARIIIKPDRQGQGLGYEFCKALIHEGWRRFGRKSVSLKVNRDNERAIKLYKQMGFAVAGKKENLPPTDVAFYMLLTLDEAREFGVE